MNQDDNEFLMVNIEAYKSMMIQLMRIIYELELRRELRKLEQRISAYHHVRLLQGLDFTKNHLRI